MEEGRREGKEVEEGKGERQGGRKGKGKEVEREKARREGRGKAKK